MESTYGEGFGLKTYMALQALILLGTFLYKMKYRTSPFGYDDVQHSEKSSWSILSCWIGS
jgi:hypothetical protein